jgi:hypothetical protein
VKLPGLFQRSLLLAGAVVLWSAGGCRSDRSQSSATESVYGAVAEGYALPPTTSGRAATYDDDAFHERQFPPGKTVIPRRHTTAGRKPGEDVFDDGNNASTSRWPFGPRPQHTVDRRRHAPWWKKKQQGADTPSLTLAGRGEAGKSRTGQRTVADAPRAAGPGPADVEVVDRNRAPSLPLPIGGRGDDVSPFDLSASPSRRDSDQARETPAAPPDTAQADVEAKEMPEAFDFAPPGDRRMATNDLPTEGAPQLPSEWDSEREPVRLLEPPPLHAAPVGGKPAVRPRTILGLKIPQIRICRRVNGFDDVVPLDAGRLRKGQSILIYATLENFHSLATAQGFRTLTLSTLEVQRKDGRVLHRQSLGTAVDLAPARRRDYFLTHLITVPEDLPPGEYIFNLSINDMLRHGRAQAQIAVRIMEDRSPRDETAGISGSATHPAGFQK